MLFTLFDTTYRWVLAFHIFAAAVWIGGAVVIQILALLAIRSKTPGRMAEFSKDAGFVGERIFAPVSLVLLLLGFWLMHQADGVWDYGDAWVIIAMLGWAATFVIGIAVLSPAAKKIGPAIGAHGVDSPEAKAAIQRILLISRIDLLILVIVLFDMAVKPGT